MNVIIRESVWFSKDSMEMYYCIINYNCKSGNANRNEEFKYFEIDCCLFVSVLAVSVRAGNVRAVKVQAVRVRAVKVSGLNTRRSSFAPPLT